MPNMTTILLAFTVMLIAVALMAVGVMMGRKPIAGSCGGLANLGLNGECEICGGSASKCPESSIEAQSDSNKKLYYPARTEKSN